MAEEEAEEMEAQPFTAEGAVNTKARRIRLLETEMLPSAYRSNSTKEDLCLEYVENFRSQFVQLFPNRKELLLCPKNECKVRKFVSTTVRATELPYRELYDVAECATFVASLLEYEPLEFPTELPEYVPSSDVVLQWKVGDCFDFAILLTSYLIGVGYDAYVVSGYAPKWVCLRDQSKTECPMLNSEVVKPGAPKQKETVAEAAAVASHYETKDRGIPKSKFLKSQEDKQQKEAELRAADDGDDEEEEEEEEDPYEGERVHAWVLVRAGKRDVQEHFFVEPSTGRIYNIDGSPYLGIESIWNNKNYWGNMQEPKEGGMHVSFDLSNLDDWEYVFIEPTVATLEGGEEGMEGMEGMEGGFGDTTEVAGAADSAPETEEDNILDIPPSWVKKLIVDRETHARRYCNYGQQIVLYDKAKLERFAENSNEQGMVLRLTLFKDKARTIPREQREEFQNRRDKLFLRIRYPLEGKVKESFLPGAYLSLKDRVEWTGRRRELVFYTSARPDSLVRRVEEIGSKNMEYFEGRDDHLIYRSVSVTMDRNDGKTPYLLPVGQLGELVIHKMTEKFGRNDSVSADEDIRKRTYNVRENTIRVIYHYTKGKITSSSRVYYKQGPNGNQPPDIIEVDPNVPKPSEEKIEEEMHAVQLAEKACYTSVRHAELEKEELLKNRKREEQNIKIDRSIFETARENAKSDSKHVARQEEEVDSDVRKVDYLSPFLQNVQNVKAMTRDEGQKARDSCLRALKERLLERANIIQTRLDEENSLLAKKQAAFQRSQRDHDQGGDEEFERFCSETMFRIQILEQRLTRHEETALQKYADMDQKLHTDPRLMALNV